METRTTQVVFVIPPKVHVLDVSGPIHMFYEARAYGAPLSLLYTSPTRAQTAQTSAGLMYTSFVAFDEISLAQGDVVVVPGLDYEQFNDAPFQALCRDFNDWLVQQHSRGVTVASVCTGAFLVGRAGLFNDRHCTTHWKFVDRFRAMFPKAKLSVKRIFVEDGNICSSAGVASGIDLSLHLIERCFGPRMALDVAKETVVFFRRGEHDEQLSHYLSYRNHLDDTIHFVQNYILEHLANTDLSLEKIAYAYGTSSRNLTRRFKAITGITVGHYIKAARVEKMTKMLQQGSKLTVVAAACGLKSTEQLRRIVKAHFGQLPKSLQSKEA